MKDNFYGYAYNGIMKNANRKLLRELYRLYVNALAKNMISNPILNSIQNHFNRQLEKLLNENR